MPTEGFTTKGKSTSRRTYVIRDDVLQELEDMADEQGWNKSDVVNRAIMYYLHEHKNGELDDPAVEDTNRNIGMNLGD